ncbi:MAG: hypothetical protein UR89_C0045G0005 [Candidatus Roizmanbacteria bacterium GW2011_GWA2_35_8]|uniref:RNA ligase partner protein n=1 Tax=Candidatus Roizmanbacteria bacterium GW2011_GWA2_35_8 TaxID=1618479 RepID=A0A0G0CXA1_9BACT|nr:MAG: hypothetical protein UR89_C0045G0005 [Candidatus Roizmanbacteria bacterium GW2011_GWA2_35_8]
MEKFILDTNLFFNMDANLGLGRKTEEIVVGLTEKITILKKNKKAQFFMPPKIVSEFLSFFENKEQDFIKSLLLQVTIKSPDISKVNLPSRVFYRLIEDVRERSHRGLNIGEEEIESSGRLFQGLKIESTKEFQIKIGGVIKKFRERYRNATRVGFLDSVADLDLIMLSLEQDGYLVTTDEGVLSWGRYFGIKEMPSQLFIKHIQGLM